MNHEPVNRPSATPAIVSRARNASTVAIASSGPTNVTKIRPTVCPSVALTHSASSAAKRNMPMPNAKNPSGTAEPYGRTTTRTCGWMLTAGASCRFVGLRNRGAPRNQLVLFQLQCCGIDAVAEAGGVRAVGEHVTEMAAAVRAHHLGAHHPVRRVGLLVDRLA